LLAKWATDTFDALNLKTKPCMNRFFKTIAGVALFASIAVNGFSQDESPVQLGADVMSPRQRQGGS